MPFWGYQEHYKKYIYHENLSENDTNWHWHDANWTDLKSHSINELIRLSLVQIAGERKRKHKNMMGGGGGGSTLTLLHQHL